jgi:hypothetical protein
VRIQGEILEAFPSRHSNFLSGAGLFCIRPCPEAFMLPEHHRDMPARVQMLSVSASIIRPVGGERQLKFPFLF